MKTEREQVCYRAISALTSHTLWFNIIMLLLYMLDLTAFQELLPPKYLNVVTGIVIPVGNMILRFQTDRPVAFFDHDGSVLKPGETKTVSVDKLPDTKG